METNFSYLYGKPEVSARLKAEFQDFVVIEDLGFTPSGDGEHVFIRVRKTGENTQYLARQIARVANVPAKQVTYAGLKDKRGVTEQTFSVHLPGKDTPDFTALNNEQVEILDITRNNKKLRTGILAGNRFEIRLRELSASEGLLARLDLVKGGAPNYFGEQRFGYQGNNLTAARQMFEGKRIKDRFKRGMYLSAARSYLFNLVVSQRIDKQLAFTAMEGDCFQLAYNRSYFTPEQIDDTIKSRLSDKEIRLSAPLWGKGELTSEQAAQAFEMATLAEYQCFREGLEQAGLKQERRAVLVMPQDFSYELSDDQLVLKFYLNSGCYATSVIRELVEVREEKYSGEE